MQDSHDDMPQFTLSSTPETQCVMTSLLHRQLDMTLPRLTAEHTLVCLLLTLTISTIISRTCRCLQTIVFFNFVLIFFRIYSEREGWYHPSSCFPAHCTQTVANLMSRNWTYSVKTQFAYVDDYRQCSQCFSTCDKVVTFPRWSNMSLMGKCCCLGNVVEYCHIIVSPPSTHSTSF